jgi:hypothetical protein
MGGISCGQSAADASPLRACVAPHTEARWPKPVRSGGCSRGTPCQAAAEKMGNQAAAKKMAGPPGWRDPGAGPPWEQRRKWRTAIFCQPGALGAAERHTRLRMRLRASATPHAAAPPQLQSSAPQLLHTRSGNRPGSAGGRGRSKAQGTRVSVAGPGTRLEPSSLAARRR